MECSRATFIGMHVPLFKSKTHVFKVWSIIIEYVFSRNKGKADRVQWRICREIFGVLVSQCTIYQSGLDKFKYGSLRKPNIFYFLLHEKKFSPTLRNVWLSEKIIIFFLNRFNTLKCLTLEHFQIFKCSKFSKCFKCLTGLECIKTLVNVEHL